MAVARSVFFWVSKSFLSRTQLGEVERTVVTSPHREQNLADVHTSNGSVGLAPGTTHSSLQSIGTGT